MSIVEINITLRRAMCLMVRDWSTNGLNILYLMAKAEFLELLAVSGFL
jgi:hypothetical protein